MTLTIHDQAKFNALMRRTYKKVYFSRLAKVETQSAERTINQSLA